ncbi:hypothetical protein AX15_004345 [Amanita polypyramis BW_CC]|nr:hypothetical protein AX15_004345 [Amanita polypyramis BW_CC]
MALAFANGLENSVEFDISDDESDHDRSYNSVYTLLVIRQRTKGANNINMMQESPRPIAGTGRVSNYYHEKKGLTHVPISGTSVQFLQSITAIPALSDRSFEEIRLECYSQSVIATGSPPQAVNISSNPSTIIPPFFMPVRDDNAEEPSPSIIMSDLCKSSQ